MVVRFNAEVSNYYRLICYANGVHMCIGENKSNMDFENSSWNKEGPGEKTTTGNYVMIFSTTTTTTLRNIIRFELLQYIRTSNNKMKLILYRENVTISKYFKRLFDRGGHNTNESIILTCTIISLVGVYGYRPNFRKQISRHLLAEKKKKKKNVYAKSFVAKNCEIRTKRRFRFVPQKPADFRYFPRAPDCRKATACKRCRQQSDITRTNVCVVADAQTCNDRRRDRV